MDSANLVGFTFHSVCESIVMPFNLSKARPPLSGLHRPQPASASARLSLQVFIIITLTKWDAFNLKMF